MRMRASRSHCPFEERSVVGGTHRKIRAWCAIQFGVESGPCALLCTAAKRSMDASWRAESRLSSPRLGSQVTSAWLTVDGNVRASCRAEYVKSKGWANAWRGRKTSGVAGEAQLRKTGWLCRRCHNFFHIFSLSWRFKTHPFREREKETPVGEFASNHSNLKRPKFDNNLHCHKRLTSYTRSCVLLSSVSSDHQARF